MRSKDYLQQAIAIEKKIKTDMRRLEAVKGSLRRRSVIYDLPAAALSARENASEDPAVRVTDYENYINSEINMLAEVRSDIENKIKCLSDDILREVLIRRYLLYQKWDVIAEEMNYGERYIYKLHLRALKEFPVSDAEEHQLAG